MMEIRYAEAEQQKNTKISRNVNGVNKTTSTYSSQPIINGTGTVTSTARSNRLKHRINMRVVYLVSGVVYLLFLLYGLPYYLTPVELRPYHKLDDLLRPTGFLGQGFGILGSLMLLFMLIYSIRKRIRFSKRLGKLSIWLQLHTYCGIMGPLFIILHTSFKIQGLVAIAFWTMIGVAISGFFGRYLYRQIPRNSEEEELTFRQMIALDKRYHYEIMETVALTKAELLWLDKFIQ